MPIDKVHQLMPCQTPAADALTPCQPQPYPVFSPHSQMCDRNWLPALDRFHTEMAQQHRQYQWPFDHGESCTSADAGTG